MKGAGLWLARQRELMTTVPGRFYLWHNGEENPLPLGAGSLALAIRFADARFRDGTCVRGVCRYQIRIAPRV